MLRQLSLYNMIREEQERVDAWVDFIKTFFIYCIILFAFALSLLAVAISIYAFMYYLFVPKIEHSFPVYMDYGDTTLLPTGKHNGPAIIAQVPLTTHHTQYTKTKLAVSDHTGDQLLEAGQGYTVILEIVAPESPKNLNLGPVMVETKLYGKSMIEKDMLAVSRRPVMMYYRSTFVKYLQNFLYAGPLAFGFLKETQRLTIFALDRFVESSTHRLLNAEVLLHNHDFEVYNVQLKIVAELKGMQYFMYYWFLPSFLIGVGNIFFFEVCSICLFGIIYLFYFNRNDNNNDNNSARSNSYNNNNNNNNRSNSDKSYNYNDNPMFRRTTPSRSNDNDDSNNNNDDETKNVVIEEDKKKNDDDAIFSDPGIRKFQKGMKLPNTKQAKENLATEFFNKIIEEDEDLMGVKLKTKYSSRTAEEILQEQRRLKAQQFKLGGSKKKILNEDDGEPFVKGEEI